MRTISITFRPGGAAIYQGVVRSVVDKPNRWLTINLADGREVWVNGDAVVLWEEIDEPPPS